MGLLQIVLTLVVGAALVAVIVRLWGSRSVGVVVAAGLAAAPSALIAGAAVAGSGRPPAAPPRLALPAIPSPDADPVGICGAQSIPAPAGTAIPRDVIPGRVSGTVEHSTLSPQGVAFCGWAASVPDHRPAQAVVVLLDGRLAGAVAPSIDRPDVEHSLGPVGELTGYSVLVPLSAFAGRHAPPHVQVLAIERGVASPLGFLCASPPHVYGCA